MTPDTEELIKKVNTLTLDKNRLKQKLNQLNQNYWSPNNHNNQSSPQSSSSEIPDVLKKQSVLPNNNHHSNSLANTNSNVIAGVDCSTSCEEDLLFINELYRSRLDEYNVNWNLIQSKCTALLAELDALQSHYSILKKEKSDIEEKLKSSCDECSSIKSELQTVVLNYETQLSAMSEHLSMITNQVNLGD